MLYVCLLRLFFLFYCFILATSQDEYEEIELTTAEAFSTADPFGHAVGEQRKAEKEKARKTLISRSKAKDVEHPLCKFYCDMFELCIQNEDLRPICGKPIGCLC